MEGWGIAMKSGFSSKGRRGMSALKFLIYGTLIFVFSISTFLNYI